MQFPWRPLEELTKSRHVRALFLVARPHKFESVLPDFIVSGWYEIREDTWYLAGFGPFNLGRDLSDCKLVCGWIPLDA